MKNKNSKKRQKKGYLRINEKNYKKISLFSLRSPISVKFRLKRWQ